MSYVLECCTWRLHHLAAHSMALPMLALSNLYHILYPLVCCAILLVNSLSLARAFQQAARRVKWQVPPQTGTYQRLVPEGCWIRDGSLGPKTQKGLAISWNHIITSVMKIASCFLVFHAGFDVFHCDFISNEIHLCYKLGRHPRIEA